MKIRLSTVMLAMLILLASYMQTQTKAIAQTPQISPDNVLVYVHYSEVTAEYVQLSAAYKQDYVLPLDKCSLVSPGGTYVAQSSLNGGDLIIFRLNTPEIFIQIPWTDEWNPCQIRWLSDTQLSIADVNQSQQWFHFEILGDELVPFDFQPPPPPNPALPDWIPSILENFLLPSPRAGIYLYERCNGLETTPGGKTCKTRPDMVIYDVTHQSELAVLQDADNVLMRGYESNVFTQSQNLISYGSAIWSHTGRYLAYQKVLTSRSPYNMYNLAIFDLDTSRYLDTSWINVQIDSGRAMEWSPQGDILAFWIEGRLGEAQPEDNDSTLRTLVFFNVDTETYSYSNQPFDLIPGAIQRVGIWSLDGQGYAFIDLGNTLFYVDASTGVATPLDTNVNRIIAWQTEEIQPTSHLTITIPPADGTTLTTQDDTRFQAVAYDPAVGTNDGDGIQQVEFEVYNPSGTLIHSLAETQAAYCAFGGNVPCNIAPSGLLGLPGMYTLKARAQSTGGTWTDWVSRTFVVSADTGTGLLGEYFGTRTLTVPVLNRVDATVGFDWGTAAPDPAVPADKFSVRWNGQVKPRFSETYTFYTRSNDGVRLWVNDQLLVDNWTDHSVTENSGTISLTAGQFYNIRMEYYEKTSEAVAQLSWSSASQPKEIIPQSQLFPGTPIPWMDTTQVVFQSDRDGNSEIYRVDTDGTDPVNLTNNAGSDANAAWRPNSRVVFQTTRDGNSEIYAMNPDGSGVQNLTNHSSFDAYPSVGPDGRIAFASTRNGGNFELYVMNADGGNVVRLTTTTGAERNPAWSPDGQWIVYDVEEGGVKDLWFIAASGGTPTRLTQNAGNNQLPDWSPDGTQIVFQTTRNGSNEVYLMDAAGNPSVFMPGGLNGFSPAWSPDNSAITFHAWSDSSVPEIYTIEPGGTNRRRLTANNFTDQNPSWGEQ